METAIRSAFGAAGDSGSPADVLHAECEATGTAIKAALDALCDMAGRSAKAALKRLQPKLCGRGRRSGGGPGVDALRALDADEHTPPPAGVIDLHTALLSPYVLLTQARAASEKSPLSPRCHEEIQIPLSASCRMSSDRH